MREGREGQTEIYLERSSLTLLGELSDMIGDTELVVETEAEGLMLYMLGSWIERRERAETDISVIKRAIGAGWWR